MHRFTLDGYLLQKTKEGMLLIPSKKKDICKYKGEAIKPIKARVRAFLS